MLLSLRALAEGTLDVAPMVTGRVGFDGVADTFELLRAAEHHVKVLVEPDGPQNPPRSDRRARQVNAPGGVNSRRRHRSGVKSAARG